MADTVGPWALLRVDAAQHRQGEWCRRPALNSREVTMRFWYGNVGGFGGGGSAGVVVMVLGMLLFWGLVIAGISLVLRQPHRARAG